MDFDFETALWRQGWQFIAGIDEAGRGPLAGPIVAAAVILLPHSRLPGLNDSKLLSEQKREQLYGLILEQALAVGVAEVSHKTIDRLRIGQANTLVMEKAVKAIGFKPDYLLIDGRSSLKKLAIPQQAIIDGDALCASIAAASVIAKVTRDRIMLRYHLKHPQYNFAGHKGYGTREHFRLLKKYGPCPIHRRSFAPVAELI
ncbi:ribonuclease HII [Candidatus Saganbacteria bacterium CG08_land_8_20_14_0_20_45_16]|uniref:Ribonuclease HII n=1 Tax=Candidatus Saganbacteria bacterium CG08_land_8_20_14_0_20_45_16 TaxID=2014293 RepID=A0A2H0XYU6_UNCSA|nr:MAG: ribonuclease HII [Candidatus Saganbacteria bacterium CG08_land_8_20_14_0_20_45_16]